MTASNIIELVAGGGAILLVVLRWVFASLERRLSLMMVSIKDVRLSVSRVDEKVDALVVTVARMKGAADERGRLAELDRQTR